MRLKNPFRPALESVEARILATAGLAVPPGEVHSLSVSQSWVEIVNATDHALTFKLSADEGSIFHSYRLNRDSSGFYHANHAASTILIKVGNAPTSTLAASPTQKGANAYTIHPDYSLTPGRNFSGGGPGGAVSVANNVVRFTILNQTTATSGSGGVPVTIQFSVDGGKTYPLQDTVPYTNGLIPRHETIYYGNEGIIYKLPANPSIRPTLLSSFGQYRLLSNSNFQPTLYPSS